MKEVTFEQLWNERIKNLEGSYVKTLAQEKLNFIHSVTNSSLTRISSNGKKSAPIPKSVFENVYYKLQQKGSITREQVNLEHPKRYSAIVVAVLAKLPNIESITKPVTLKFKK